MSHLRKHSYSLGFPVRGPRESLSPETWQTHQPSWTSLHLVTKMQTSWGSKGLVTLTQALEGFKREKSRPINLLELVERASLALLGKKSQ